MTVEGSKFDPLNHRASIPTRLGGRGEVATVASTFLEQQPAVE